MQDLKYTVRYAFVFLLSQHEAKVHATRLLIIFFACFLFHFDFLAKAHAEQTLVSIQNTSLGNALLEGALDIGGAAFNLPTTNFGAGSYEGQYSHHHLLGYKHYHDNTYGEFYGKPMVKALWETPWNFNVIGKASAVGSATLGDGDAEGTAESLGNSRGITLEEANLGVQLPIMDGKTKDTLTILGGPQVFQIDDGFLMGKAGFSAGDGAWWYAPRFAFQGPGTIRFEGKHIRSDIFVLESHNNHDTNFIWDKPETKFAGFDVSWFNSKPGGNGGASYADRASYVTLTYFHIYNADISKYYNNATRGDRQGMDVAALSWGGTLFPIKALDIDKNFTFYGDFVSEQNRHAGNGYSGVSAYAMYFEPGYTFSMLPWAPHLFYRYTRFGGGKNAKGGVKHNYDTLFLYDGNRYTYGGFWPGEAIGVYLAPLSDMEIHQVDLTATPPSLHLLKPDDSMKLGLHFYDLSLLHPSGMGLPPNVGRHFFNELDASAEYTYDATTSVAFIGGCASAGPSGFGLAKSSVPAIAERATNLKKHSGVVEAYFYKHF